MTSRRDPGPILAAIGGAVVLAAIVWGFIAVGGPGDARAERLDQITLNEMAEWAGAAKCARIIAGDIPATRKDIDGVIAEGALRTPPVECHYRQFGDRLSASRVTSFNVVSTDEIEICGEFLLPSPAPQASMAAGMFKEFTEPRPAAGNHCYRVRVAATAPPQ